MNYDLTVTLKSSFVLSSNDDLIDQIIDFNPIIIIQLLIP